MSDHWHIYTREWDLLCFLMNHSLMPLKFPACMQLPKEFHDIELNDRLIKLLVRINSEFTGVENASLPLVKCTS